jgi:hypothetical protein
MENGYKKCIDCNVFVEIDTVLQKYLGRPSESLMDGTHDVIRTLLIEYDYTWSIKLHPYHELDRQRIIAAMAGKKNIKQFNGKLFTEIDNILKKYIGEFSKSLAKLMSIIIKIIIRSSGYQVKITYKRDVMSSPTVKSLVKNI